MDHVVTILEVLRQRPGASRSELAELTGLSPATISRAVGKLVREGLVDERVVDAPGLGRPPRVLELKSGAAHVLGIDAGGSRIRAVLTDLEGSVQASATAAVRAPGDGAAVVEAISRIAADARSHVKDGRVFAAAAGISGIVDQTTGRVLLSPDLPGLERVTLAEHLGKALGLPVAIENDDILAAVAEATLGAARGCSDVVFLSLGYGLGAGLIVGGRPVRGARSAAGAIAYLAPGKLEDRASGRAIPLRYLERLGSKDGASSDGGAVDAKEVFRRAAAGDPIAAEVVNEAVASLGDLVVNVAALLGPEVVVIGGGLVREGTRLIDALAERLAAGVPYPPRLVPSQLGDDAVAQGAAVLALTLAKQGLTSRRRSPAIHAQPARVGALELV